MLGVLVVALVAAIDAALGGQRMMRASARPHAARLVSTGCKPVRIRLRYPDGRRIYAYSGCDRTA